MFATDSRSGFAESDLPKVGHFVPTDPFDTDRVEANPTANSSATTSDENGVRVSNRAEPNAEQLREVSDSQYYSCECGDRFGIDPTIATACPGCGHVVNVRARNAEAVTLSVEEFDSLETGGQRASNFVSDAAAAGKLRGLMLGHFLLEDVLGRGGMGAVYRALDTSLQRHVAVKVINEIKFGRDHHSTAAAIVREAVAQARLNHPNIVTIYYVGRTDDEPFLAMELVNGSTLRNRLEEGRISYGDMIDISLQLVRALEHASRINIVHGDIKPNNLLLDEAGNVKLSDFGLARSTLEINENLPLSGTPTYMAPELLETCQVSVQSDMYAVGVTLFEMAFGRLPYAFDGQSVRQQLRTHATEAVQFPEPWPTEIPAELRPILECLLAKDPQQRYPDYGKFLRELELIQPVNTTIAGIALRAAAFAIDQAILLACFFPFGALIYMLQVWMAKYAGYGATLKPWNLAIALAALVVPLAAIQMTRKGWRTPGKYLFQLRVTEQHGLLLSRRLALWRAVFRNTTGWLIPLGLFGGIYFSLVNEITYVIVLLLLLAEVICAISSPDRRSVHDLICGSRVVLDSKPSHHANRSKRNYRRQLPTASFELSSSTTQAEPGALDS